jgi:hypothetical protein
VCHSAPYRSRLGSARAFQLRQICHCHVAHPLRWRGVRLDAKFFERMALGPPPYGSTHRGSGLWGYIEQAFRRARKAGPRLFGLQIQIPKLDVRGLPVDSAGNAPAADIAAQGQIYRGLMELSPPRIPGQGRCTKLRCPLSHQVRLSGPMQVVFTRDFQKRDFPMGNSEKANL